MDNEKPMVNPIEFLIFGSQSLMRHIFCRAIKITNLGVAAIAYQCPLSIASIALFETISNLMLSAHGTFF